MKALLAGLLIVTVFIGAAFLRGGRPVSHTAENRLFVVSKGEGTRDIASALADAKLIRSKNYFLFLVWRHHDTFKAGSFELSPTMSAEEIEKALAGKPISNEREVTILESWTLDDIADYLEKEGVAAKKDFFAEVGESAKPLKAGSLPDWEATYTFLDSKPATASLEGYLFPDTYRIYTDAGAKALIRRMLSNFEDKFSPALRKEAEARGKSIHEIVTMASIIEREVRGEEDRAMVSDLFWKRLAAGHGLEADSTVNYLTGSSKPSVSYLDTKIDNPWNTYKYKGLPPGPIGNPSLSAIIAALRPKANPYWFFLTDKQGNVHYGKTLDEHNANKAKYLR
jgi:UPF0755 protein